uniref:Uncharacterized protein n=1 Tax=Anabas testudineus TaxID=64144 RepID=A0A3Q1IVE2_ANATE
MVHVLTFLQVELCLRVLTSLVNVTVCVSLVELRTVATGLLLIGGVVIAVSVTGCVGADRELRLLLLIYLGFLVVLILGQLFVTLLLLLNRNKIEQSLDEAVDQVIFQYRADTLMDNVQHYGKCCGRTGPADWLRNSYIQSLNLTSPDVLPCSCFISSLPGLNSSWCSELLNFTEPLFGRGSGLYDEGCKQKLSVWLQENSLTIIGLDVGLILIQVIKPVSVYFTHHMANPDHTPLEHLDDGERNYAYVDPDSGYLYRTNPAHYNILKKMDKYWSRLCLLMHL